MDVLKQQKQVQICLESLKKNIITFKSLQNNKLNMIYNYNLVEKLCKTYLSCLGRIIVVFLLWNNKGTKVLHMLFTKIASKNIDKESKLYLHLKDALLKITDHTRPSLVWLLLTICIDNQHSIARICVLKFNTHMFTKVTWWLSVSLYMGLFRSQKRLNC